MLRPGYLGVSNILHNIFRKNSPCADTPLCQPETFLQIGKFFFRADFPDFLGENDGMAGT
jgi:hypothetical protein